MNSITETYKNHPSITDHLVPLDYHSVDAIPKSHEWVQSSADHPIILDAHSFPPIIDLSEIHTNATKSLIRQACEEWGVFQVINHGVSIRILREFEHQIQELFSLPMDRKLRALRPPNGVTGYGMPRSSEFFSKLMWFEGFTLVGSSSVENIATQLWPNEPNKRHIFCTVMDDYRKEMRALIERLLDVMLESLGSTLEEVEWLKPKMDPNKDQQMLQLNSYPICPNPNKVMGLAPHTDSSLVTTLFQSDYNGFQVLREGIGWIPVDPVPDAVVVNLGDLMHIVSNGLFKGILHRAVPDRTRQRLTAAFFYGPPSDAKVSPLIGSIDQDRPPLYRPISWKEFLEVKQKHWYNTLGHIRNENGKLAA